MRKEMIISEKTMRELKISQRGFSQIEPKRILLRLGSTIPEIY